MPSSHIFIGHFCNCGLTGSYLNFFRMSLTVMWAYFFAPLTIRQVLYSLDLIQVRLDATAPDLRAIVQFAEDQSIHNDYKCIWVNCTLCGFGLSVPSAPYNWTMSKRLICQAGVTKNSKTFYRCNGANFLSQPCLFEIKALIPKMTSLVLSGLIRSLF